MDLVYLLAFLFPRCRERRVVMSYEMDWRSIWLLVTVVNRYYFYLLCRRGCVMFIRELAYGGLGPLLKSEKVPCIWLQALSLGIARSR
jgi:hypothetical protein